jgi:hypothetical protein
VETDYVATFIVESNQDDGNGTRETVSGHITINRYDNEKKLLEEVRVTGEGKHTMITLLHILMKYILPKS